MCGYVMGVIVIYKMHDLLNRIIFKLSKRTFIHNYSKYCTKKTGRVLLYYKTDPFFYKMVTKEHAHGNNWEILEITRIFNMLGFWVDIIDRTKNLKNFRIEDKYDIFMGLGAGDSGRYYSLIAEKLTKAIKIFYAAGPEPEQSNLLIKKRYDFFYDRNPGKPVKLRRTINKVDINRAMQFTDVIFCMGNEFSLGTYKKFNKPIFRIYPSTSPDITINMDSLCSKDQRKFIYFGGNGNVVKGLDLVIEAFCELPEFELYICAPEHEEDFNAAYQNILAKSRNIHFLGFIKVGGDTFNQVTSECGYVIFPSCSEGTAYSVVTCMRRGLIPIVTYESGIDLGDFGYLIEDINIESLRLLIKNISNEPRHEFIKRSINTYFNSFNYTQAKFSESFEKALISILNEKKIYINEK